MVKQDLNFFEYCAQAQLEVLTDRERQIAELRYGLTGSKPLTLASIGEVFNISRERVRQLLNRAFRKIRSKGQRQIKTNEIDAPCAELLIYIR